MKKIILAVIASVLLVGTAIHVCADTKKPQASAEAVVPLAEGEMDVSGVYEGYEVYTTPNRFTTNMPDYVIFPWSWKLKRTGVNQYRVEFYHPATEASGSIKAVPEYRCGINNVKLSKGDTIGIPNYIAVQFEERNGVMMGRGHFKMIKASGEVDVRTVVLTKTGEYTGQ